MLQRPLIFRYGEIDSMVMRKDICHNWKSKNNVEIDIKCQKIDPEISFLGEFAILS